jgi:hypothetical protein
VRDEEKQKHRERVGGKQAEPNVLGVKTGDPTYETVRPTAEATTRELVNATDKPANTRSSAMKWM